MKKWVYTAALGALLTTSVNASQACPTEQERYIGAGFGVMQGIIGSFALGPVGPLWGIGVVIYSMTGGDCDAAPAEGNAAASAPTEVANTKEAAVVAAAPVEAKSKIVQIEGAVHFAFDSYKIEGGTPKAITDISKKDLEKITLEGNTDKVGTEEYNMALGLKRAQAVKKLMVEEGFDANMIKTISYGKTRPISTEDALNRRVDITLEYGPAK